MVSDIQYHRQFFSLYIDHFSVLFEQEKRVGCHTDTNLAAKGALAHRMQRRTAWYIQSKKELKGVHPLVSVPSD